MCPAGMILAETLLAWSFCYGSWEPVALCMDEDDRGHVILQRTMEEVDIYQATIPGKTFWVIDEEEIK